MKADNPYGLLPHATVPFPHQDEALRRSFKKRVFALLMEQGTGKTKVTIDNAALLYQAGHIRACVVLAPNDVHAQWVDEALPKHWPLPPAKDTLLPLLWKNSRGKTLLRQVRELIARPPKQLVFLAMNHEALSSHIGPQLLKLLMKAFPALLVIDESHNFKVPKNQRVKLLNNVLADLAFARRILTGTPVTQSPFDLYVQFRFLDPRILGFDSFLAFKHRYGEWEEDYVMRKKKDGSKAPEAFERLVHYQNLEELYARISSYSFVIKKSQCLDLPPKMYARLPTHLSDAQQALYTGLKEEGLLLLRRAEKGEVVTPLKIDAMTEEELTERLPDARGRLSLKIKMVLMLRLMQISGGFVVDDEGDCTAIDGDILKTPRMEVCLDVVKRALAERSGKILIWATFRPQLEALQRLIQSELKEECGLIYGGVPPVTRQRTLARFKNKDDSLQVLAGHPRSIGTGQDFHLASTVIYYSNSPSYALRAQSEDRAHRIGQKGTVTIYDLIGAPVDQTVLDILRNARGFAEQIMSINDFHKRI